MKILFIIRSGANKFHIAAHNNRSVAILTILISHNKLKQCVIVMHIIMSDSKTPYCKCNKQDFPIKSKTKVRQCVHD